MLDPGMLDDLVRRLAEAVPPGARAIQEDLEKSFRAVLQSAFARLDLVTREEFDAQSRVLARTRELLEGLEARVARLEEAAGLGRPPGEAAGAVAPAAPGAGDAGAQGAARAPGPEESGGG
ncbi:MAG: accessory factor UbiK family protein [Gammaproteobacteria bacterium]|nr:MAG: accessory factor UbiK family protein [Gammaproteobacteria bacterium]